MSKPSGRLVACWLVTHQSLRHLRSFKITGWLEHLSRNIYLLTNNSRRLSV